MYHQRRQTQTARQMNPVPYHASYFGQKLHVDQNEKLVMFGVTHICARDGYSGMVVAFASMSVKNNVEIYKHAFRYNNNIVFQENDNIISVRKQHPLTNYYNYINQL